MLRKTKTDISEQSMMDVLNLGDRKEYNKISVAVQDVHQLKPLEERKRSESSTETIQCRNMLKLKD